MGLCAGTRGAREGPGSVLGRGGCLACGDCAHGARRGAPAGPSEADRRAEEFRSWITGLETVPEFRRLGVATAILDGIEAVLAELGARYIALWVAVENEVACEIYARRGYREVAVLPRIGEDCRLMVKDVGVTLDQAAGEDG